MDKIRKIAESLWYNKERIVFGVMVCILFWHVYSIFNPPEEVVLAPLNPPKEEPDPGEIAEIPPRPEPRPIQQWEGIYTPNPFWSLSGSYSLSSKTKEAPADISLVRIQQGREGKWRAQLRTNVTKWYNEGESFQSFQLIKINPDDNSVEVRSDRLGRVLTLRVP